MSIVVVLELLTVRDKINLALLRAMAEKLIPGLPESLKIAILQQRDDCDGDDTATTGITGEKQGSPEGLGKRTVLQTVLQSDISRTDIARKVKSMCKSNQQ